MVLEWRIMALAVVFVSTLMCSSQAFFVTTALRPAATPKCGAMSYPSFMNRNCWAGEMQPYYHAARRVEAGRRGYAWRERRRGLRMKYLEEVPEALVDKVLVLEEEATGRTLACYAERFAVVDGNRYLAAFPKDPAVAIAFEENGEVAPVPLADPLIDQLFPLAEASVQDLGPEVILLRTPASLTVRGLDDLQGAPGSGEFETDGEDDGEYEGEEEDEEAFFNIDDGEEEEDEGQEEDEDSFEAPADEVELLGEFVLEGEEFLLVRFLEPLLILAKETDDGRFVLIGEEEDQDVNPVVEEMLRIADAL